MSVVAVGGQQVLDFGRPGRGVNLDLDSPHSVQLRMNVASPARLIYRRLTSSKHQ